MGRRVVVKKRGSSGWDGSADWFQDSAGPDLGLIQIFQDEIAFSCF